MSASSVCRIKERGGAGKKFSTAKPSKSLTLASDKVVPHDDVLRKSSPRKENLRSTSKPSIEKPCFGLSSDRESKTRQSTLSVLRGRSFSPSELTHFLSHLRKNQGSSKVSVDGYGKALRGENEQSVSRGRKAASVSESIQKKGVRDSSVKRTEKSEKVIRVSKDNVNLSMDSSIFKLYRYARASVSASRRLV